MIITLALALLIQETPEEILKALAETDTVARGEAIDKIVAKGRTAIPSLRKAVEKADGDARKAALGVIDRIGSAEVVALLKKEGHTELSDLKVVTGEALTKVAPHARLSLLPGNAACKACGSVQRILVLNDLADDKGAPRLVKSSDDVALLFPGAAATEDGRRATAAAAFYVLRALHPKAHTKELVPTDNEAFADPKLLVFKKTDAGTSATAEFKIDHAYYHATMEFDSEGVLKKIVLVDTGKRCL